MSQPYLSLEAELHDAFWEAEDDASEVPLMAQFLHRFPGNALEVGCGSGRLMCPLVSQGFNIEGLELSEDMLKLSKIRAAKHAITPTIHHGDMSSWTPSSPYHAVLAPAFTLQLAKDPLATLKHWASWITPNGGLYLSIFMPFNELLGHVPQNVWYPDHHAILPDGSKAWLKTRHKVDPNNRTITRNHHYNIESSPPLSYQSTQTIRYFDHEELLNFLSDAGFDCFHSFLDFNPNYTPKKWSPDDFDGIITYHARKS